MQLQSLITSEGMLRLSLEEVVLPAPAPDQIVVRVEASPLNPSDLGLMFGPVDPTTLAASGTHSRPIITGLLPRAALVPLQARIGQGMPVGNEGAGTVVDAGADVRHWIGRTVALPGGAMYSEYRIARAEDALLLSESATPAQGASAFINPLTALAMIETMRAEGHTALVHTAAASNLGQMLNRICLADGVPLVNIVRSPAQSAILAKIGAPHIVDSSSPEFRAALEDAIEATGATLAFDALGGGPIAGQILSAMEASETAKLTAYSRYGSPVHKQVYLYGALDIRPTEIGRDVGMAWGVGGFLLPYFLARAAPDVSQRMRERVAAELTSTFASHYSSEISLREVLRPDIITRYLRKATGEKFLLNPAKA